MPFSRRNVEELAESLFSDSDVQEILTILDEYGSQSYELEPDRVKCAILELSKGNLEKLRYFVKIAKTDYRDILAFKELGPLSKEEGEKLTLAAKKLLK